MRTLFVKRTNASKHFSTFLITFALTVVVTRIYLHLTGYLQIGNEIFHIAHLTWGGLGLLIASLMLMMYRGRVVLIIGSIMSGIGWGLFIDEIGKFITVTNDYFFRPAAAIIYVVFLGCFLLLLYMKRKEQHSVKSRLYDVLEGLEEVIEQDLNVKERLRIEEELESIIEDTTDKNIDLLARQLLEFIHKQEVSPPENDILYKFSRIQDYWDSFIDTIPEDLITKIFKTVIALRVLGSFLWLMAVFLAITGAETGSFLQNYIDTIQIEHSGNIMLFVGMNALRFFLSLVLLTTLSGLDKNRKETLRIITLTLWISLGLVDVFDFYFNQFEAVIATVVDVSLLAFIRDYSHKLVKER
ncbi:hypothetical protein H6763_04060 [Candidatus Nomurabacteria bacterium]|uniref:Uncharacterized protein n=1 Tax=Candidatus Dojkabacteria bacterium TaxID=2099670 RepID=A0A955I204_9BACT|nr:hypothetical protein [Candidatus Dojkabacteria bacterium]MCB9789569.1 hypothetical protein [Candidatus Nomurabacteria bacterium]MCB9803974.1 hypothetical protein [Candidatus Nomurabacteria bacterium]